VKTLWSRLAVGFALGLVVLLSTALLTDILADGHALRNLHWSNLPLVLALTLANYGLRFLKWHYYVRVVGARSLPWPRSLQIFPDDPLLHAVAGRRSRRDHAPARTRNGGPPGGDLAVRSGQGRFLS
jgi:hypothetical protein